MILVIGYDPYFVHDNKIEIRVKEKLCMLNLNKRKQISFLANNLNMPLGIICITEVHKILIRGMLIFSARYDDSTPIKCKTCFAAYPAVNLNASIMLCSHNTFTSTISYRLHFTNHKFHHHTSDDGTINPNFSR